MWAGRAGLRFLHIPLHLLRPPTVAELKRAPAPVTDPALRPLYVHCDNGRPHRMVIAAYRHPDPGLDLQRRLRRNGPAGGIGGFWTSLAGGEPFYGLRKRGVSSHRRTSARPCNLN